MKTHILQAFEFNFLLIAAYSFLSFGSLMLQEPEVAEAGAPTPVISFIPAPISVTFGACVVVVVGALVNVRGGQCK